LPTRRRGDAVRAAAIPWAGAGDVRANRPLTTDTADTIPDGRCQFEPYAGHHRSRSAHQSSTIYAAATEYTVVPDIVLSAELCGDDRVSRPWLAAGVLWQLREALTVNASYAVQRSDPRVRQFTAGFLIEF
jgi:hypothetical protein